jgi:hypothetical protein
MDIPDMALSDYHPFPVKKQNSQGYGFQDGREMKLALTRGLIK